MVSVMLGSVKMEFEEIESIPEARCYSTACVINKELHIIGGCDSKGKPVAYVIFITAEQIHFKFDSAC